MLSLTTILVSSLAALSFASAGDPALQRRQGGECIVTTGAALASAGNDPTCSTVTVPPMILPVSQALNFTGIENKHFVRVLLQRLSVNLVEQHGILEYSRGHRVCLGRQSLASCVTLCSRTCEQLDSKHFLDTKW